MYFRWQPITETSKNKSNKPRKQKTRLKEI
jgi:hypothetical protein